MELRLRMLPAGIDISILNQRRKDAAAATRQPDEENEYNDVCWCQGTGVATSTCKKSKACPIGKKDRDLLLLMDNHSPLTLHQLMAINACYIPMLNDYYMFDIIFMAAILGRSKEQEFMQLMREFGVRMGHIDSYGNTILILACAARPHSSVAIDFVLSKASKEYINAVNHDGLAALHFATLNYLPEVVETLLALGADPNAGRVCVGGRYFGLTPLLISVNTKHGKKNRCLQALLNYDADINVKLARSVDDLRSLNFRLECNCGGCTSCRLTTLTEVLAPSKILTHKFKPAGNAMFHTMRGGPPAVMHTLLNKYKEQGQLHEVLKEPTNDEGHSLFTFAITYFLLDVMKVMVRMDPSVVNQVVKYNGMQRMTPLHMILSEQRLFSHVACGWCIQFSQDFVTNVINVLLDTENINLHARNENRETPIMLALMNGHDYVTEKMLNLGADPFTIDERGNVPVSLAMSLEPTVRLQMFNILFKTGLSHKIYQQEYELSRLLKAMLAAKDLKLFQLFCRAGAINSKNRIRMYEFAQTLSGWPSPQEKDRYLKALSDTTPRPLLEIVVLWISAQVGLLTPKDHALALECSINKIKLIEDGNESIQDDRQNKDDHEQDEAENELMDVTVDEAEKGVKAVSEALEAVSEELKAVKAVSEEVKAESEEVKCVSEKVKAVREKVKALNEEVKAVSEEVKAVSKKVKAVKAHTQGQHFWEIYKIFFEELNLV